MNKQTTRPWPQILALLNCTLLLVHQIDSAFWHEWDMFRLPGGNQLNLALNVPIVGLVVYAYGKVAAGIGSTALWQKFIAALGFLTLIIHAGFFTVGHTEFAQPASFAVFLAIGIVSVAQLIASRGRGR